MVMGFMSKTTRGEAAVFVVPGAQTSKLSAPGSSKKQWEHKQGTACAPMMMITQAFICSCRNKKWEPPIFCLFLRTIRALHQLVRRGCYPLHQPSAKLSPGMSCHLAARSPIFRTKAILFRTAARSLHRSPPYTVAMISSGPLPPLICITTTHAPPTG